MNSEKTANSIEGLITSLNYHVYTPHEVDILIAITDYIRPISREESYILYNEVPYVNEYRIKEGTESDIIFQRLKEAYSDRRVEDEVIKLLEQYELYEILTHFTS